MKKETKTIRVRDLLFSVLYGWKAIICAGLILALLMGGCLGIQGLRQLDSASQTIAQEKYADAMSQYRNAYSTLTLNIQLQQDKVELWEDYMANSILMHADHRSIFEARASLYIQTDYKIDPQLVVQSPDYTESVMLHYVTLLQGSTIYEHVAKQLDMETTYLRELVSLNRHGNTTISVLVRHPQRDMAAKIMDLILSYILGLQPDISKTVGEHTIRATEPALAQAVSSEVEELQKEKRGEMGQDLDELMEKWEKREKLVQPTSSVMTRGKMLKNTIKGAIAGGILGVALAAAFLVVAFLLSDKIYSGEALAQRMGIRVLGSLPSEKKYDPVRKFLRKLEGRNRENREFIGARAANCCREAVVLCGNVEKKYMAAVSQLLSSHGVQVASAGDVLCDGAVVAALRNASGVVLVARCGKTTYTEISRMAELTQEADAPILAAITID